MAIEQGKVSLRWSDNGGKTWSGPFYAYQQATGQNSFRTMWRRIGSTRRNSGLDRIFEVSSDDPYQVSLIGAYLGED